MRPTGLGIAVGDHALLRTEDFGQHWRVLPQGDFTGSVRPMYAEFNTVQALSDDVFVTAGRDSFFAGPPPFYRSEDGGVTWTQLGASDFDDAWEVYHLEFINASEGWLFGF